MEKLVHADLFVFYDTCLLSKGSFQNRNRIELDGAPKWLTMPLDRSHEYQPAIEDLAVANNEWQKKHFNTLDCAYHRAKYWQEIADIKALYENQYHGFPDAALAFLKYLMHKLEIDTPVIYASSFLSGNAQIQKWPSDKLATGHLIDMCLELGADTYYSGRCGPDYMDMDLFDRASIKVEVQNFWGPSYYSAIHHIATEGSEKCREYIHDIRRTDSDVVSTE